METAALTFARPALLHFLWLLPLVVALFWWAETRRRALIGRIVAPKLRVLLAGNTSPARRWFRWACVLGALGLLVVTMAGPRLGYDTLEVPHRGRDVIIAMDVSRSMLATDVAPSRLDRAKLLAEDLIDELSSDRIGLIAFAGSAFLQAPLTLDHGAVLAALDEMDTSVIPKGGTNLAAAIRMAEEAFGKAEGFSRALIIISDGEELDADGVAAAKQAAAAGIRIFTVGVGSSEGSEIQLESGDLVRDPAGKVVRSRLDEGRMRQIAEAAGGFYTPLDEGAAQRLAVDGVGKLAEAEFNANSSRRPIERYQWPLGAAIALLVLQTLVGERRRRPSAALALAAWVCLPSSAAWSAPAGVAAYEQGDYERARQVFEERLRSEPDAPNLQMNAGAAAYRLKDYGKAAEYFSRAMLSEEPALRSAAEFNLANTLFRLGQGQEDRAKKKTDWKDAIAKYAAALKARPDYREAKENKEQVEKLLQQLEEEEKKEQEQKQDQQKKDQKQDKQDQKKQDQQKNQQDQKQDQQPGGQQKQDQQDQSSGDQNKEQQQGGGDQKKDQQQGGDQKQDQQQGQGDQQQDQQQGGKDQNQPSADGGQDKKDQQGGQGQEDKEQQGASGEKKDEQQSGDAKKDQQQQGGGDQKKDQQQQGGDRDQQGEQQGRQPGEEKSPQGSGDQPPQDQKGPQGEQGREEGSDGAGEQSPQTGASRPLDGSGDKPAPVPQSSGEKKEGELRAAGGAQEGGQDQQGVAEAVSEAEVEEDGKMSAAQARALLRSLQSEEEQVNLLERRNLQDVSRDW